MALLIDKEKCTACGLCVDACPFGALSVPDDTAVVGDGCTLCGACMDTCPTSAISMEQIARKTDERTARSKGVWVWAEQVNGQMPEVVAELLGQGRKLADELAVPLGAALVGHQVEPLAAELIAFGADEVYLMDHPSLASYDDNAYAHAMDELIKTYQPEILLAGATSLGRSMVPRLATLSKSGLTADCTSLAIDPATRLLRQTRPAFGGNIMATIICPEARPQMSTVRPRVMKKAEYVAGRRGNVIKAMAEKAFNPMTKIISSHASEGETVNLVAAEVVVTGGRGLGKPEGFALVRELAQALGGVVGASRAAVDSEWIGYPHQVGQTGRTIGPKLYIALGVSGAVQHLVGMQSSDTIVAINNNPDAPIFQVATYGIVGDLYQVVPAMIKRIKEIQG